MLLYCSVISPSVIGKALPMTAPSSEGALETFCVSIKVLLIYKGQSHLLVRLPLLFCDL